MADVIRASLDSRKDVVRGDRGGGRDRRGVPPSADGNVAAYFKGNKDIRSVYTSRLLHQHAVYTRTITTESAVLNQSN